MKAKDRAEVIATWEDGTPAVVLSRDPKRRVAYIGGPFHDTSFLARMSEWAGGMLPRAP